jgi:hypothetical protein
MPDRFGEGGELFVGGGAFDLSRQRPNCFGTLWWAAARIVDADWVV